MAYQNGDQLTYIVADRIAYPPYTEQEAHTQAEKVFAEALARDGLEPGEIILTWKTTVDELRWSIYANIGWDLIAIGHPESAAAYVYTANAVPETGRFAERVAEMRRQGEAIREWVHTPPEWIGR